MGGTCIFKGTRKFVMMMIITELESIEGSLFFLNFFENSFVLGI